MAFCWSSGGLTAEQAWRVYVSFHFLFRSAALFSLTQRLVCKTSTVYCAAQYISSSRTAAAPQYRVPTHLLRWDSRALLLCSIDPNLPIVVLYWLGIYYISIVSRRTYWVLYWLVIDLLYSRLFTSTCTPEKVENPENAEVARPRNPSRKNCSSEKKTLEQRGSGDGTQSI